MPVSFAEEDSNGPETSIISQGIVIFSWEKTGVAAQNNDTHNNISDFFTIVYLRKPLLMQSPCSQPFVQKQLRPLNYTWRYL